MAVKQKSFNIYKTNYESALKNTWPLQKAVILYGTPTLDKTWTKLCHIS